MKYGTTLIVLSIVNFATIFSGFPTGWKRFFVTIISILILLIGWILRAQAHKKKAKLAKQADEIYSKYEEPLEELAEEMTQATLSQFEHDIESLEYKD